MISTSILAILMQASGGAAAPAAPQPVTRAAFQATVKANFEQLDANKDGWVDKAEALKSLTANVAIAQKNRAEQVSAQFAKLDTNKDGSLSRQEFDAMFANVRAAEGFPWVTANDADKDGRVSLVEATVKAMADFDMRDTDRNGIVSAREAQARPVAATQGR